MPTLNLLCFILLCIKFMLLHIISGPRGAVAQRTDCKRDGCGCCSHLWNELFFFARSGTKKNRENELCHLSRNIKKMCGEWSVITLGSKSV